jgi:hypothetical protein
MLTPDDKQWLRDTIQQIVAPVLSPAGAPLGRLTIEEFAAAVELHPDTVRRKIRVREIPSECVFGQRDMRIAPRALELFGVTPSEARARLAARNPQPTSSPSPA